MRIFFQSKKWTIYINQLSLDTVEQNQKLTETYMCSDKVNIGGDSYSVNIINPCNSPTPITTFRTTSSTSLSSSDSQNLTIQVFNSMGSVVLSTNNKQFSLSGLMIGTYYVRVIKGGAVVYSQTLLKN